MINIEFVEDAYSDVAVYQAVEDAKLHCSDKVCDIIDLFRLVRLSMKENNLTADIPFNNFEESLCKCGHPRFVAQSIMRAIEPLSDRIFVLNLDVLQDLELDLVACELIKISKQ